MKQKHELEVEIAAALKSVRTAIRLRHSLAADREINEVLPDLEAKMLEAAAAGKSYQLDLAGVWS